jgi:hypothetical protein
MFLELNILPHQPVLLIFISGALVSTDNGQELLLQSFLSHAKVENGSTGMQVRHEVRIRKDCQEVQVEAIRVELHVVIVELDVLFPFDILDVPIDERCQCRIELFSEALADDVPALEEGCF